MISTFHTNNKALVIIFLFFLLLGCKEKINNAFKYKKIIEGDYKMYVEKIDQMNIINLDIYNKKITHTIINDFKKNSVYKLVEIHDFKILYEPSGDTHIEVAEHSYGYDVLKPIDQAINANDMVKSFDKIFTFSYIDEKPVLLCDYELGYIYINSQ
jgi:hypothetical protein